MAGKKISELTELIAPTSTDILPIVDISETETKKITRAHLIATLPDLGIDASADELNILDGAILSTAELNHLDGVTSAIQTQLNTKVQVGGDLGGTITAPTVTDLTIASEAKGDILFRGATSWQRLAAGTAGQFLKTQGTETAPIWETGTTIGLGDWESKIFDTVYEATTDGFVLATGRAYAGATTYYVNLFGYTDADNPPTTLVVRGGTVGNVSVNIYTSITMPVKKGNYWKVTYEVSNGDTTSIYFIPIS